ncbi:hypothetical protein [Paenibacillus rigui]|uniref:Uncharacterized protein n=1 Tax=Paenibacillus rigui TaxID=554312 RepID=A0A229ULG3_9BACL|nr:hypothetical protein [Paenibacillus rigui]OXM83749.1 hypothetical protein CF651_24475 [Paenibacillus rigui]
MTDKIAVQFRKSLRTRHAFERLKHCKGCSSYSVLWGDRCLKCGAEGKFVPLKELTASIHRRNAIRDGLILGSISLGAFAIAGTFMEMALALLAGIGLLVGYVLLNGRYAEAMHRKALYQLLLYENQAIREGLLLDIDDAANDLKTDDYKSAYEKLREIGYLITGNQVKVLKLMCLNHFILRSDMDLELSTVIPEAFDKDFIRYLTEVCKVSPQLVGRETLNYVVKNRVLIEALPDGREIMALVAGSALRVKAYVVQYEELIADFVDQFPKDRLLRLYRLIQESPSDYLLLYGKVTETVKRKYGAEPAFQTSAAAGGEADE